jgi:uncharacterized membrane protein YfcA
VPALPVLVLLGMGGAFLGALGGIGGAVLLVPVLVLIGVDPLVAAPLGLLTVAAGSLAAGAGQLELGLVHHRLGVTLEITASAGAVAGAMLAEVIEIDVLVRALGVVTLAAAAAGIARKGIRNRPSGLFSAEPAGEWPGTLGGSYHLGDEVVPYHARRVPLGLVSMIAAGFVSGIAGVGGGFIKTPVMSEIMHVPVKVAAATSTFTVGITAAAGLLVFTAQGRIDYEAGGAVVVGGLVGGFAGGVLSGRLDPMRVRTVLTTLLVAVGLLLVVRG